MNLFLASLFALLAFAAPAHADPISATIIGWLGITSKIGVAIVGFLVKTIASLALSALSAALQSKPKPPGLRSSFTAKGGINSASFIFGRYATPGMWATVPMSHGTGGTPNEFLTLIIALADVPGHTLNRIVLNGEYVEVEVAAPGTYGNRLLGKYTDKAWVRFYGGAQTVADAGTLTLYGSYPDRPWTATMVGTGVCYAIVTLRYDRELFQGVPENMLFELDGLRLYDPRADTTVGGSGAQRFATPSTWTFTTNPAVMIYNILRGIIMPDGSIWGGEAEAADLPLASWFAAMNVCDVSTALQAGGTELQYRAGFEVRVAEDEPADIIDELLKACSGSISEMGGVYKMRAGGPGLPVMTMVDDDILVSESQDFAPFPGADQSSNGIHAAYPDPASLWEERDAPPIYDAIYLAADGGRQQVASVALPAVPYAVQVQRLMRAWLIDDRRWRRHNLFLGPYGAALEPLDTVAWTSERNGYVSKVFEVDQAALDLQTCNPSLAIRERDPQDYDWSPSFTLPSAPAAVGWALPTVQTVPSWAVNGVTLLDGASNIRRPAIELLWVGTSQPDVRGLEWELRLNGGTIVQMRGSVQDVASGRFIISDGIIPGQAYQARGQFVVDRPTAWTSWVTAIAPVVLVGRLDIAQQAVIASMIAVTNAENLYVDGHFDNADAAIVLATGTGASFSFTAPGVNSQTGQTALILSRPAGQTADFRLSAAYWTSVIPGADYWTACSARASAVTSAGFSFQVQWADAAKGFISSSFVANNVGLTDADWAVFAAQVVAPANARFAYWQFVHLSSNPDATNIFIDRVVLRRANAAQLTADGTITGGLVAQETLTGDNFVAGSINTRTLNIDEKLTIDATDAGFVMGKVSASDFTADGLFMGRALAASGGPGFGFLMGRTTTAGVKEYIQHTTDTGLAIVNAQYALALDVAPAAQALTTSQTFVLAAGVKTISFTAMGGGASPTTAGGLTRVRLFSGATDTGVSWSSAGGLAGGSPNGRTGQSSSLGVGGAGGTQRFQGSADNEVITSPKPGTGFGAGGGAAHDNSANGGRAATATTVNLYDVSAVVSPRLVITIGAAGTGAAAGSPGVVRLEQSLAVLVPAGVIPLYPTAAGTFAKAANATGITVFPNLGLGMWVLTELDGNELRIGRVVVDTFANFMDVLQARSVTFIANRRPEVTIGDGNARTIRYLFYRMKV